MVNPRKSSKAPHSTPTLLAALTYFSKVGMRSPAPVSFSGRFATFNGAWGRFSAPVNDAIDECVVDGAELLKVVKDAKGTVVFHLAGETLTIDVNGARFALAAKPCEDAPVATGTTVDTLEVGDQFIELAKLAADHSGRLFLIGPRLCVFSGTCMAERYLKVSAMRVELPTELSKLAGVSEGWVARVAVARLKLTSPAGLVAAVGWLMTDQAEPKLNEFPSAGAFAPVPAGFFELLANAKKHARDGLVDFDEQTGAAVVRTSSGLAWLTNSVETTLRGEFKIEDLLSIKPLALRIAYVNKNGFPLLFWHDMKNTRGVVAGVAVGTVDG